MSLTQIFARVQAINDFANFVGNVSCVLFQLSPPPRRVSRHLSKWWNMDANPINPV
jgi:hypothetical protein